MKRAIEVLSSRKFWRPFIGYILVPILIAVLFSLVFQDPIEDFKNKRASEPYVAVLVSKKAIDFDIPIDFNDGFEQVKSSGEGTFTSKDNKKVKIVHFEDFLSESESSRIISDLIEDKNCIMIIGNSNSTLTNANIDQLMANDEKIPIIMPIATDNNIMKKAIAAEHHGILRMLPDNSEQADMIQRLAFKLTDERKVAIYGDEENYSYSINLSREVSDKIRTKGGVVLAEELLGPSNSIYNSIDFLTNKELMPKVIVYVGVSHHAFLLIDQLSALGLSIPVIFSDGCLVGPIFQQASLKYEDKSYILSPALLNDENSISESYGLIGQDAFKLASIVFHQANANRASVYDCIANKKNELGFEGMAGKYEFNRDGNNEGREYHAYQISGGRTKEIIDFSRIE